MVKTGLIIAAGAGSRLADHREIPKPLRVVAGLTLLRRIILLAHRAGLERMVIVVGHQKEKIQEYVSAESWPLIVECVENPEWQKSNGVSVLTAKEHIRENFALLMSDHVFESETLRDLCQQPLDAVDALLAVDYKIDRIFDMPDATKVVERNQRIQAISKNLTEFNCIDTGMFLMTPKIFDALSRVKETRGDCSLSDGIGELAQAERMGTYDIGPRYWQDVDTPEGRKEAERVLLNSCRKASDGFFSRHFNRYVSLFMSKYLLHTPITPNQLTILFFIFTGIPAAYLASLGGYASFFWATVLFQMGSILDGVDGEIARLKFLNSKLGQWLDTACDNAAYLLFFIGVAIGLNHSQPGLLTTAINSAALLGLVLILVLAFVTLARKTESGTMLAFQDAMKKRAASGGLYDILTRLQFIIRRDFFAVLFLVFGLLGKPLWVMIGLALVTNIGWLVILDLGRGMSKNTA